MFDSWLKVGPVSVAIDATRGGFRSYKSGVFYDPYCSSSALDHAVLAVGYGSEVYNIWENLIGKNKVGQKWLNFWPQTKFLPTKIFKPFVSISMFLFAID